MVVLMSTPQIAVVIVNYNGYDDTIECLNSIREINYKKYHVIAVDNASNDTSINNIKSIFPEIHFIKSHKNLGFTGGNNLGVEKAYELDVKYVFFLNNDTIISKNILTDLASFMEKNPEYGLIGPLTYYYNDKNTIAFAGGHIDRNTGLITFYHKGKNRTELSEVFFPCSFIEGAALFVRTDLFKKIGGFNDDYFLTSEESELCIKIKDLGYKLGVLNSCSIWHKVSKSMISHSELATYFIFRNKLHFVKNNKKNFTCLNFIQILTYYITCFLSFLKKKNWGAVRGIFWGTIDFFLGKKGPGRFRRDLIRKI